MRQGNKNGIEKGHNKKKRVNTNEGREGYYKKEDSGTKER